MLTPIEIKQIIKEENPKAMFLESPFDIALIGTGRACGSTNHVAVYDSSKCLEVLINHFHIEEIDAYDHFCQTIKEQDKTLNSPIFVSNFKNIKISLEEIDENSTIDDITSSL